MGFGIWDINHGKKKNPQGVDKQLLADFLLRYLAQYYIIIKPTKR